MKLLHLSSIGNRGSILNNGLIPSIVKSESHLDVFKRSGLDGNKCVYTWDSDRGQSTDKYIRDMIYCKLFIHPRNDLFDKHYEKHEEDLDFKQFGTKLYGKTDVYDLFEISINPSNKLLLQNYWVHGQLREDNPHSTCHLLNDKYAHDDKVLYISGDTIPPNMFKLVTSVKTRLYKNDTIGVSYSKNL